MSTEGDLNPNVLGALSELQETIRERWPEAEFRVSEGDDPRGIYLDAIVDIDDPDEVMDLVVDRLLDMQVEEGLPVHVVPLRPLERALAMTRTQVSRTATEPGVEMNLEPTHRLRS